MKPSWITFKKNLRFLMYCYLEKKMNIVSLHENEPLYIGDKIKIVVLNFDQTGNIELGIIAPENISIHREEWLEYLKKFKMQLDKL